MKDRLCDFFLIYVLFLAALGLGCCPLALSSCGVQLLIAVASPAAEHRL